MDGSRQNPKDDEQGQNPFFVEVATPSDALGQEALRRQITVGGQSDHQIDYLHDTPPTFAISLAGVPMALFVAATAIFFSAFTVISYYGIVVEKFTIDVGGDASKIEDRVKLFNAISGFVLALFEVLIGLFIGNFLPVLLVYLHNLLWSMHQTGTSSKVLAGVRAVVMFVFPVVLMLLVGNSVRSLQAAQSTVGFETTITLDDLRSDPPVIETVKAAIAKVTNSTNSSAISDLEKDSHSLGPLQTAVDGSGTPFVVGKSQCSKIFEAAKVDFQLSEHDLDTVMTVFGFDGSEWISEALDTKLAQTEDLTYQYTNFAESNASVSEPKKFDMRLAFELFGQAKVLLDKSLADTEDDYEPCAKYPSVPGEELKRRLQTDPNASPTPTPTPSASAGDGSLGGGEGEVGDGAEGNTSEPTTFRDCATDHAVLTKVGEYLAEPSALTVENLVTLVGDGLEASVENINKNTTVVKLDSYQINSQLSLQMMVIDVAIEIPDSIFFTVNEEGRRVYEYEEWGSEFCGSSNCVFLDLAGGSRVAQQIVVMPHQSNCSFSKIEYSSDVRGFFPPDCEPQSNSAVAFSTSTFIKADEYGSDVTKYDPSLTSGSPYLVNPRRWLRIAVAKFTWKSENLASNFGVGCRRDGGEAACTGISYRLPRTGRYLFSSDDALPTHKMIENKVSLVKPVRLLQVNEASLYLPQIALKQKVVPERLDWNSKSLYNTTKWTKNALKRGQCSMLIDSYIRHITTNRYYLDRPYSAVYRAAFAYIFSNGSVTELNDTSVFVNGTNGRLTNLTELLSKENLSNVKLKGDVVLRNIRVSVPSSSFKATIIGCGALVLLALLVVLTSSRRVEYFPPETTKAEEFIEISKDEKYPPLVHDKTICFPESGRVLPFSDLSVDQLTLRHRVSHDREIEL